MKMSCKSYCEAVLQIHTEHASTMASPGAQIGPHIFKKKWENHALPPGTLLVLPGESQKSLLACPGRPWDSPGGTPRSSLELFLGTPVLQGRSQQATDSSYPR